MKWFITASVRSDSQSSNITKEKKQTAEIYAFVSFKYSRRNDWSMDQKPSGDVLFTLQYSFPRPCGVDSDVQKKCAHLI